MAYLDSLPREAVARDRRVSALYWPAWEMTTPQYPQPNPYTLANEGYRRNELIYACINKWMKAIAEAPLRVYDNRGKTPDELPDHPLRTLVRQPNPYQSEKSFWRTTEIFLKIAGFSAWEIEFDNLGAPLHLWPMSPHWCAFRRGPGKPIAWIEYQPWGIELQPVPIERVLLFQYMDPISPFVKALAPSAVAGRVGAVDNHTTDFLKLFMEHGAVVNGLLSTEQPLQEAEAQMYRRMWAEQHGGYANWTDPAVLGQGIKYQQTQMDFRQMTFGDLDARDETRICQAFAMQPILVSAKVGLDRSTFSNYDEARKAQYEEEYMPEWDWLEAEVQNQLGPKFDDIAAQPATFLLDFDISQVHALQEDRTAKWTRAGSAFTTGLATRDEAREEMNLDPIDNAAVFYADTRPAPPPSPFGFAASGSQPMDAAVAGDRRKPAPPRDGDDEDADAGDDVLKAARARERKQFKAFADKRIKEGKPEKVHAFQFKILPRREQVRVLADALSWKAYP